jgi:7-keto-8-aminopelargonate synthetase-like enzyme
MPPILQSAPGPRAVIDGRDVLYFAGTGYLGLHARPELVDAAVAAMRAYGMSAATTRAGFGNSPPVLEVERLAAQFFGTEAAFYFTSGYAGPAVLAAIAGGDVDAVFVDEAAHYSVMDAARLTGKPIHPFAHRDAGALRDLLRAKLAARGRPLVFTDGVFSVSGRIAPLSDYLEALSPYAGAILAVDDAHGMGVIGDHGRGTLDHFGLFDGRVNAVGLPDETRILLCGTLSKALGGSGGIVPGSAAFIEDVARRAPAYFAASPPPAATAAATGRALQIAMAEPQLRAALQQNVRRLRSGLRSLGLAADESPTPVVALELPTADQMRAVQARLMGRGIAIAYHAAYSGTGPQGALRIAAFATHTAEMIDQLVGALRAAL